MTLVSELADQGYPLAEPAYSCYLEVDREEHQAIIVWVEPLAFHAVYNGPTDHPAHAGYPAWSTPDNWTRHAQESGWLTGPAVRAIVARLQGFIGDKGSVGVLESGDDEPVIAFEIATTYRAGETFEQWYNRVGWPIVATLINVTDPGSFMSPYLFSMGDL